MASFVKRNLRACQSDIIILNARLDALEAKFASLVKKSEEEILTGLFQKYPGMYARLKGLVERFEIEHYGEEKS